MTIDFSMRYVALKPRVLPDAWIDVTDETLYCGLPCPAFFSGQLWDAAVGPTFQPESGRGKSLAGEDRGPLDRLERVVLDGTREAIKKDPGWSDRRSFYVSYFHCVHFGDHRKHLNMQLRFELRRWRDKAAIFFDVA